MRLSIRARLDTLRGGILPVLSWWAGQLRDLMDVALSRVAPNLSRRIFVQVDATCATFHELQARKLRPILSADLTDASLQVDALATLNGARATVVLEPRDYLTYEIIVPSALRRELDQVVRLKVEREAPLTVESLAMDYWISDRLVDPERLVVTVLLSRRARLEQLRGLITTWGLRLQRIGIVGKPDRWDSLAGNLLSNPDRQRRWVLSATDRLLLRTAVTLTVACLGLVLGQWIYERVRVNAELHRQQDAANIVRNLERKWDRDSAPLRRLAQVALQPDAAAVLKDLSNLTPSDTWVFELQTLAPADGPIAIRLKALAPTTGSLFQILEKSNRFGALQLTAATSDVLGVSVQRLEISSIAGAEVVSNGSSGP